MAEDISLGVFNSIGNRYAKQQMLQTLKVTKPIVTNNDIEEGIKTRYFARYKSDRYGTIYELSEGDYFAIEQNSLFQKTKIDWIIRGRLQDIALTLGDGTSMLVKGVISQNQALLAIANEKIPGIIQHLQNHMEYWSGE